MDTKKLEALLTAVELGSFTRAAEVLGYTQSGLTHMMNSLEKDIGFTVLLRGRSGVRLTPAGQRILPLVRDCLGTTAALEREISLINTHKEDSVRVAAYESIARHWLPEIIQQFRREHPGCHCGHPDGQRRRGLSLGAGGSGGYVLCQPPGRPAGVDISAG